MYVLRSLTPGRSLGIFNKIRNERSVSLVKTYLETSERLKNICWQSTCIYLRFAEIPKSIDFLILKINSAKKMLHGQENGGITFPLVYPFIKHWPDWDQFTKGLTRGKVILPFSGWWSNFVSNWSPRWKSRLTSVFLQNKAVRMYFGTIKL